MSESSDVQLLHLGGPFDMRWRLFGAVPDQYTGMTEGHVPRVYTAYTFADPHDDKRHTAMVCEGVDMDWAADQFVDGMQMLRFDQAIMAGYDPILLGC